MKTWIYEAANFNKYKQFWHKDLFDLVKSFDPAPDNRYEAWILDTLRRMITYEVQQKLKVRYNPPKEVAKLFLQNMLLEPSLYEGGHPHAKLMFFVNRLGYHLSQGGEVTTPDGRIIPLEDKTMQFIHNESIYLSQLSDYFQRYVQTDEDRNTLMEALEIHRWLSESNRLNPQQKNIYNFQNFNQLYELVNPFIREYEEVKKNLAIASRVQKGVDYDLLFHQEGTQEIPETTIVRIKTFLGSQYWASGTNWCIKSSEEYLRLYTNNGTAPCIYFIRGNMKWAFVEGDRNKLSNPSEYIKVQYRDPTNQPLTFMKVNNGIPNALKDLLAKHLWLFQFLKGEIKVEKAEEFEYVYQVMDAMHDSGRDQTLQYIYEEAGERYWNDPDRDGFDYDSMDSYQHNVEKEDKGKCEACFGSGYAFTFKEGDEYVTQLPEDELNRIYEAIKEKNTDDAFLFKNNHIRYGWSSGKNLYQPKIELGYEEYPEDTVIFKLAEKYKNTCGRCGGSGEHEGDEIFSHDQINSAFEGWEDDQRSEYENSYYDDIRNTRIDDIDVDLKNELEDALERPLTGAISLDTMENNTNLEPIGQALVNENGIHPAPAIQETIRRSNLIEKLLRRFK